MLWLEEHTRRIRSLVEEGSPESLTFAALRSRMAIEAVCYDRLRNAHGYISPADLKRWQPADIVTRLIQEVDPHIASEFTLSISSQPVGEDDELRDQDYVEVGRQVGFNADALRKLWNGLGSFLHVRVPKAHSESLSVFGPSDDMKKKVLEAVVELERLQKGSLIASGFGNAVRFECVCGSTNKRRAALLQDGQTVSCIKPDCQERWLAHREGDDFKFERRKTEVTCHACGAVATFPEKPVLDLKRTDRMHFTCECGVENYVMWRLMQVQPVSRPAAGATLPPVGRERL